MRRTWTHDDLFRAGPVLSAGEQVGYGESWWAAPMTWDEFSSRARQELPRMRVLAHRAVVNAKDTSA